MNETTVLDERAETLLRTFKAEHPRVTEATIVLVEGVTYRLDVEGACYRAVLLDGQRALFVMADPTDVSVDLAPSVVRPLVAAPEPVAVPDPSVFDVNAERRRALGLLEKLRHHGEQIRLRTRHCATSRSDEVARLGALIPSDAVDASYRPVSHDLTLLRMSREAVETVVMLGELRRLLAEAETYRRAVSPRLRDAQVALATARAGTESLAGVPSLVTLGELAADRFSQAEINQDDLGDKLDVLRRACEELAPLVERFEVAVQVHTAAMLETVRRAAMVSATATLSRLRTAAEAVRTVTEAETLAAEAADRMGVMAPTLTWPASNLLEPPRLG